MTLDNTTAVVGTCIPVVAALTLFLNRTKLPAGLRPSWAIVSATGVAGLFFAFFAAYYLSQLVTR